jgi:hypothetical protein
MQGVHRFLTGFDVTSDEVPAIGVHQPSGWRCTSSTHPFQTSIAPAMAMVTPRVCRTNGETLGMFRTAAASGSPNPGSRCAATTSGVPLLVSYAVGRIVKSRPALPGQRSQV